MGWLLSFNSILLLYIRALRSGVVTKIAIRNICRIWRRRQITLHTTIIIICSRFPSTGWSCTNKIATSFTVRFLSLVTAWTQVICCWSSIQLTTWVNTGLRLLTRTTCTFRCLSLSLLFFFKPFFGWLNIVFNHLFIVLWFLVSLKPCHINITVHNTTYHPSHCPYFHNLCSNPGFFLLLCRFCGWFATRLVCCITADFGFLTLCSCLFIFWIVFLACIR